MSSSQTYNVPNFLLSTTSRPSPLSLCHPPVWAPSLFFGGSWIPSLAPLSSTLPVTGFLSSQPQVLTPISVSSIHIHASQTWTWDFIKVQILIHHVLGGRRVVCYPAFPTSSWVIPMPLSMGHSVWKDYITWLPYYFPSWACLSPKDLILQNDLLPPKPASSLELLLP